MNALLVNPWITDFKLYDEWMHPVGLYLLGSLLIENSWKVEYINCLERDNSVKSKRYNTGKFKSTIIETPSIFNEIDRHYRLYGISEESFSQKLDTVSKPDAIFITSGMTYWLDGLKKCYEQIQHKFPDTIIIIGGISAQLIPEKLKELFPKASIFNKQLINRNSVNFKNKLILEKNSSPLSLLPMLSHIKNMIHGPILTTLGCPYSCSYCASKIIQKKFHTRPTEIIFNEIKKMTEIYGISDFSFYDDALLFKPEKNFLPLAEKILKLNKTLRFHAPNGLHIKWVDKNILAMMKNIGFKTLRFGYESGNKKHVDYTGYKTEQNEISEKVKLILKAGFPAKDIGIYVMGGLPDQTPDLMYEDVKFINSLGIKAKPVFISPVPQTPLYDFYREKYPDLESDPRIQNDIFFITKVDNWGSDQVKKIRNKILMLNRSTENN